MQGKNYIFKTIFLFQYASNRKIKYAISRILHNNLFTSILLFCNNDLVKCVKFNNKLFAGVCDHKGLFIDCFIGMPGRVHDARVFRNSPLYQHMTNIEAPWIQNNLHLIGDTAYPLLCNLMTPFKDNGHLTRSQISYNTKLSSIRSIIEAAFGLLKVKFRILKYLDISDFALGNNMIAAACVLHNFIINGDRLFIEEENYIVDADMEVPLDDNMIDEENLEAAEKRRHIVQQL